MAKILIVEDNSTEAEIIGDWLESKRHLVEKVADGVKAIEYLRFNDYDLAIIDWNLPGKSGIDICKQSRASGCTMPIVMVTGRGTVNEIGLGLDAGADDYVTKPIDLGQFEARLRALLRRSSVKQQEKTIEHSGVILDLSSGLLRSENNTIMLPRSEAELLWLLMKNADRYISTDALMSRLPDLLSSRASLANSLKRLRKHLRDLGKLNLIETRPGQGYRFTGKNSNGIS